MSYLAPQASPPVGLRHRQHAILIVRVLLGLQDVTMKPRHRAGRDKGQREQ
jgi:hypothetical protein